MPAFELVGRGAGADGGGLERMPMPIDVSPYFYAGFLGFVAVVLALDLGIFNRRAHTPTFREALAWTSVWTTLALLFGAFVGVRFGSGPALDWYTAWLIEQSLSIDNLFVFVVIFAALRIPAAQQHRVLFWGVLSAVVLRAVMVFGGALLIARFQWLLLVFGAFLVVTGWRLWRAGAGTGATEPRLLGWLRARLRVATAVDDRFLVRQEGRWRPTSLLLALLAVEVTDVVFAVDSIPAVFAVTADPFLVFTSNIFAILGLRSLYFVLGGMADRFVYLKPALGIVLGFVGAKLLLHGVVAVPSLVSLLVIVTVLTVAIVASPRRGRDGQPAARQLPGAASSATHEPTP